MYTRMYTRGSLGSSVRSVKVKLVHTVSGNGNESHPMCPILTNQHSSDSVGLGLTETLVVWFELAISVALAGGSQAEEELDDFCLSAGTRSASWRCCWYLVAVEGGRTFGRTREGKRNVQ